MKRVLLLLLFSVMSIVALGQKSDKFTVHGTVTEKKTGEPAVGAVVWIKDSQFATTTDMDGKYSLEVTGNYGFINVSLIGFQQVERPLSHKDQMLNVALEEDSTMLEEAVAVGYGHQKKASIVGAISTIDPDALKVPVAKVSNALAGRLSGVISYSLLTNREVIAISQDRLGCVARRIVHTDAESVWFRPLAGGDVAVALVNTSPKARRVSIDLSELGLEGVYRVRDCWKQEDEGRVSGTLSAEVLPHATKLVRLRCADCPKCEETTSATDVIFDTDANNELDDQHAIAYLLMNTDSFNTLGLTTNNTENGGGIAGQSAEARRVVSLCGKWGDGKIVYDGAEKNFDDIRNDVHRKDFDGSAAVDFIIDNARNYSPESKLTLIAVGKLTNVALALMKAPQIASSIRLVWLGGNYPDPGEYNLECDIPSLNYVLDSEIEFEIVTVGNRKPNGTDAVRVTRDFVNENFAGRGPRLSVPVTGRHGGEFNCFGDYAVNLFSNVHLRNNTRALFDLCAVAIVKNPDWAHKSEIPAPTMIDGKWVERPDNTRKISIWTDFDRDGIVNDFTETLIRTTD